MDETTFKYKLLATLQAIADSLKTIAEMLDVIQENGATEIKELRGVTDSINGLQVETREGFKAVVTALQTSTYDR